MSKEQLVKTSFEAQQHALFEQVHTVNAPRPRSTRTTGRTSPVRAPRSGVPLRLVSLAALVAALTLLGYVSYGAYHAVTDSVVAPMILTPESELVTAAKLSLNKLLSERENVARRLSDNQELAKAAAHSSEQLQRLKTTADQALNWSDAISERLASATASDLGVLAQQKDVLEKALVSKRAHLGELRRNMAATLVPKADVVKGEVELRELEHLALQNQRERLQASARLAESHLTQQALHGKRRLVTPEMVDQQKSLVHIDLELVKLETEQRTRAQAITSDEAELRRLDQMIAELRAKPSFQALEEKQDLAFVPYTQLHGVNAGAEVYECELFGVFDCERVGSILKLFPGEVVMPDPWGNPTRGRYAAMRLEEPSAATARSLRVRFGEANAEVWSSEDGTTEDRNAATAE